MKKPKATEPTTTPETPTPEASATPETTTEHSGLITPAQASAAFSPKPE